MEENIFAANNTDKGLKHADFADYANFSAYESPSQESLALPNANIKFRKEQKTYWQEN